MSPRMKALKSMGLNDKSTFSFSCHQWIVSFFIINFCFEWEYICTFSHSNDAFSCFIVVHVFLTRHRDDVVGRGENGKEHEVHIRTAELVHNTMIIYTWCSCSFHSDSPPVINVRYTKVLPFFPRCFSPDDKFCVCWFGRKENLR